MIQETERLTLSCEEAAKILGLGRSKVYEMARQNQPAIFLRFGRRIVVSKPALLRLLEGCNSNGDERVPS